MRIEPIMELKEEIRSWPRLNVDYLETEQIEHEIFIRNLPFLRNTYDVHTPSTLKHVNTHIASDPYDPLSVGTLRIDSEEERNRQQLEFNRCKTGIGALISQPILDSTMMIHRAMHFLFRLERLDLLPIDTLEKKVGLRKRVRELIQRCLTLITPTVHSTDRRETTINIGDELEENAISDPIPPITPVDDIPIKSSTGTLPKTQTNTVPPKNVDTQGLEHLITTLFTNFKREMEQKLNDRLNNIETRQIDNFRQPIHIGAQSEHKPSSPPMPSTHVPTQFRPSVSPEQEFRFPHVPTHPNVPHFEQNFRPDVNSTYRQSTSTRTRRDEDNSAFRKIDALSKWILCFNGTTIDEKHLALNDNIISIERFVKLQKLNADDVLPYLLPTLSGNARIWYNAEGDSINTLKQFFQGLRENFDYKQNPTDVMAAVLKQQFDPTQDRLITHINRMECEMANCNIPSATQLELVLKTLPENLRMMAATRDVKNLIDLRKWALKLFPPTIGEVKTKRKDYRRYDDKKKSVLTLDASESECSGTESSDSAEHDMTQQINAVVKKFMPRPESKHRHKQTFSKTKKEDINTNSSSHTNQLTVDSSKVEGDEDSICFQCRSFGHSFRTCTAPRRHSFCYECGRPGVQNKHTCTSTSCIAKRDQKNA